MTWPGRLCVWLPEKALRSKASIVYIWVFRSWFKGVWHLISGIQYGTSNLLIETLDLVISPWRSLGREDIGWLDFLHCFYLSLDFGWVWCFDSREAAVWFYSRLWYFWVWRDYTTACSITTKGFMCWMSVDLVRNLHKYHDSVPRLGRLSDRAVVGSRTNVW